MSTTSTGEFVEHVVLLKIDDDEDQTAINAMVNGISFLNSIPEVLYLTAGPILRSRPNSLNYTHMIHARFRSDSDPVSVNKALIKPISEDEMAVNWAVGSINGPEALHPGRAMRINLLKFKKEGLHGEGEKEKNEVLEGLKRIEENSELFEQISFGENFGTERSQGFSIGTMVVFHDLNELDACEDYEYSMRKLMEKVKGSIDEVVSVDYVVPRLSHFESM